MEERKLIIVYSKAEEIFAKALKELIDSVFKTKGKDEADENLLQIKTEICSEKDYQNLNESYLGDAYVILTGVKKRSKMFPDVEPKVAEYGVAYGWNDKHCKMWIYDSLKPDEMQIMVEHFKELVNRFAEQSEEWKFFWQSVDRRTIMPWIVTSPVVLPWNPLIFFPTSLRLIASAFKTAKSKRTGLQYAYMITKFVGEDLSEFIGIK